MARRSFEGVVNPGIVTAKGAQPGGGNGSPPCRIVEIPERDQTELPMLRIEAARQWLVRQGPMGQKVANIVMEEFIRLQAVRSYAGSFPDGDVKSMLLKIIDGKMTVIPVQ